MVHQEINKINEPSTDSAFNNLSKTLKEIEELIASIPTTTENESIISSLKDKITLSQNQLNELQTQRNSENSNSNNLANSNSNIQQMDNKMDLILNKMDIMLNLINSKDLGPNNDAPVEKNYENGDKYVGQLINGKRQGKGTMTYVDQTSYEGEWYNNLKNGQGVQTFISGDKYEGNFKNDLMEGYGTYTYKNGRIYEGQFVKGVMEGKGRYKFPTGNEYIGDFKGMVMGLFLMPMGIGSKGFIKTEKKMEKVLIILNREKSLLESGIRIKGVEKGL